MGNLVEKKFVGTDICGEGQREAEAYFTTIFSILRRIIELALLVPDKKTRLHAVCEADRLEYTQRIRSINLKRRGPFHVREQLEMHLRGFSNKKPKLNRSSEFKRALDDLTSHRILDVSTKAAGQKSHSR